MKTVCIYHSIDLDGWMSAAIVKKWSEEQRYCSVCNQPLDKDWAGSTPCCGGLTTYDPIEFIGYNYGQPIPDLSKYDKVIMCDISFPKDEMVKISENAHFVWLDHHISAIKENSALLDKFNILRSTGILDTKFAACELTWKYFFPNETMPETVRLLGRYDCFGHKGTDEEQKVLEFQYGARQSISNYEEAYGRLINSLEHKNTPKDLNIPTIESQILEQGESIYAYLCTEAKQSYKNRFTIYFGEYAFCAINKERFNPINFGINYHNDKADDIYYYDGCACFHYANGMWNFSLYNDNGKVDCSIIAKSFGGGGHKGAAGMIVSNLNEVFKTLNKN